MKNLLSRLVFAGLLCGGLLSLRAAPAHPKLVMLIAEPEYHTIETLPKFAAQFLAKDFDVVTVTGSTAKGESSLDRIDEIKNADVILISVWRRALPPAQLQVLKDYIKAGRPVVGIRTACHAFVLRKGAPGAGQIDWPDWDTDIFGGSYTNHYADGGPAAQVEALVPDHPILQGVHVPFSSQSKLYKVAPLKANAQAILSGSIPGHPSEPVAYVAKRADGGRSFFTSLGGPTDFDDPSFQRLLTNGLKWAAGRPTTQP